MGRRSRRRGEGLEKHRCVVIESRGSASQKSAVADVSGRKRRRRKGGGSEGIVKVVEFRIGCRMRCRLMYVSYSS